VHAGRDHDRSQRHRPRGARAGDVPAAFAEPTRRPLPDGLVRTELLAGRDGDWKIQSLCRDQAAPDAMRAGPEPPAAPTLFRSA
jgi:hypothetical protein